jgi:hypothetical protein
MLARSGDALVGSFDALPADSLALTTQAPVPPLIDVFPVVAVGGVVLCVAAGALVGRWLGHRRRRSAWAVLPALAAGTAWAVAVVLSAAIPYLGTVPDEQVAWTYGYGRWMIGFLAGVVALPVGFVVTQVAAVVANRRARSRLAPPPSGGGLG